MTGCCFGLIYAFITKRNISHFSSSKPFTNVYSLVFTVTSRNIIFLSCPWRKLRQRGPDENLIFLMSCFSAELLLWYWWWEIWCGQGSSSHQHANIAVCPGPWIENTYGCWKVTAVLQLFPPIGGTAAVGMFFGLKSVQTQQKRFAHNQAYYVLQHNSCVNTPIKFSWNYELLTQDALEVIARLWRGENNSASNSV